MAAIIWVGGTLFTSLIVQPALREILPDHLRMSVYRAVGAKLIVVQWAAWGALLLTGSWKLWEVRATPQVFFGPFGEILLIKICLIIAMVILSLIHARLWGPALVDGNLDPIHRRALIRRMAFWGKMNGLIMAGIVFCAALLRFNPW
jgi:uncharacterized membrane protein